MRHKTLLGINIDHVATLRQARGTSYPSLVAATKIVEAAGADGITIHLREDRRHIQDADVYELIDVITTKMNLEIAVTDEMLAIACDVKPVDVCLVPEKREELTTEGGLDVVSNIERLRDATIQLHESKIRVSPFIDPDFKQLDAVKAIGAEFCEIHTGKFADATTVIGRDIELKRVLDAITYSHEIGLKPNAGHGLTLENVNDILVNNNIYELNIGHSVISNAIFVGLRAAVINFKSKL